MVGGLATPHTPQHYFLGSRHTPQTPQTPRTIFVKKQSHTVWNRALIGPMCILSMFARTYTTKKFDIEKRSSSSITLYTSGMIADPFLPPVTSPKLISREYFQLAWDKIKRFLSTKVMTPIRAWRALSKLTTWKYKKKNSF